MNVFIKKLQKLNSCKSPPPFPSSSFSLVPILPNELICKILTFLPVLDLLAIYNIASTVLNEMVANELMKRLEQNQLGIRLYFDQETRWRYTLDMKLHMVRTHNHGTISLSPPRLLFVPIARKQQEHVFYTSKLLRRPTLYKIALITSHSNSNNSNNYLLVHQQNLLDKSYTMDIKQSGRSYTAEIMDAAKYLLTYNVSETPAHVTKARPGERWIQHSVFECDLTWLCYQPESTAFNNKWFSISTPTTPRRKMDMGLHSTTKPSSSGCGHHHRLHHLAKQAAELGVTVASMVSNYRSRRYRKSIGTSTHIPGLVCL